MFAANMRNLTEGVLPHRPPCFMMHHRFTGTPLKQIHSKVASNKPLLITVLEHVRKTFIATVDKDESDGELVGPFWMLLRGLVRFTITGV